MKFTGAMINKYGSGAYKTNPRKPASNAPTGRFFLGTAFGPLLWLWNKARKGQCDDSAWNFGSAWLADIFESLGGAIEIDGLANVAALGEPCVIIANHMSTLETFLLPSIIRPIQPVTFIVKKSLTTMPIFGPIMRSRDPIAIGRSNPREDLTTVLGEGVKRLRSGISVIVFPQHTRSLNFDAAQFNSIGVKLARKAGAPIIPLALKTDAWGIGKRIKELGRIRPDLPVRFRFGEAMRASGNGREEQARICEFISSALRAWQAADGVNK